MEKVKSLYWIFWFKSDSFTTFLELLITVRGTIFCDLELEVPFYFTIRTVSPNKDWWNQTREIFLRASAAPSNLVSLMGSARWCQDFLARECVTPGVMSCQATGNLPPHSDETWSWEMSPFWEERRERERERSHNFAETLLVLPAKSRIYFPAKVNHSEAAGYVEILSPDAIIYAAGRS